MKLDPLVQERISKAQADLKAAISLSRNRSDPLPDQIGFFCQQSVGKLLKAFLVSKNISPPHTHDLAEIADIAASLDSALSPLSDWCEGLTEFAVEFRYPGAQATVEEARDALKRARKIHRYLLKEQFRLS